MVMGFVFGQPDGDHRCDRVLFCRSRVSGRTRKSTSYAWNVMMTYRFRLPFLEECCRIPVRACPAEFASSFQNLTHRPSQPAHIRSLLDWTLPTEILP